MKLDTVAGAIGRGLIAGLVGTAAITLSQTVEMKLRNRKPSTTPADAAGKVLGVKPTSEQDAVRFANIVHWGYGTSWGAARGLIDLVGLRGLRADAAHFGVVSATAMTMLPALKVAPPPQKQPPKEMAVESLHHLVYALATGITYAWLKANTASSRSR